MSVKTITRRQLCQYGASQYQARIATQNITPITVKQGVHVYRLNEVIRAVRVYLKHPGIKGESRAAMQTVLEILLQQLDNVIVAPFGMTPEQKISFFVHYILQGKSHLNQQQIGVAAEIFRFDSTHDHSLEG